MRQQLLFLVLLLFFFQTKAQTTTTVSSTSPLNVDYCYSNNESDFFTYTCGDGMPLNLVINSGMVEGNPYDFLVILDSDGVTELYHGEGNNGNLSGLTFQSTGDSITFSIISDVSMSCASGSFSDGINYTVSCITCNNSSVAFSVISDCVNSEQFFIEANISDFGSATSLTISNDINGDTIPLTQSGIYQVGPFSLGTLVVVSVSNDDDANCVINSNPLTFISCPPPNDEPCNAYTVVVNGNNCDSITSGTILGATPSAVPYDVCNGNPNDDVWFKFTALYEVERISIVNTVGGTTNIDHSLYQGACGSLTEIYCSNEENSATPALIVGNEYYVRVFSGGSISESSTFDLCIQKAPSNIVCEQAIAFCANGEGFTANNIIGVNELGMVACLGSTPNPSWNFIQIGESGNIEMQISQVDESNNGLDVDFVLWGPYNSLDTACSNIDLIHCPTCPNNTLDSSFYPFNDIIDCSYSTYSIENFTIDNAESGEIYILLVTNYSNEAGTITITQTNSNDANAGTIVGDFEIDLGPDRNLCNTSPSTTLNAYSPFADVYEWYKDGILLQGEVNSTLVVTESGTYSISGFNENCEYIATDDLAVNFVDCENAGLIHVNAFYDTNGNSLFDSNENNFSNGYFTYELNGDGNVNYVSSSTGSFTLSSFEETETYNFAYYFYDEYQDCYNVTITTFDNVSVANGSEITVNFPVVNDQSCEDIAVYLIGNTSPKSGFDYTNYLSIENLGLVTTSGTIDFVLDDNLILNSVNANPNYTIIPSTTGFTLDFVNLQPEFSLNALVSLFCPSNVSIGDMVTNTATFTTSSNDTVAENNSSTLTQTVVGSYDPNDITEVHGPQIVYNDFVASNEYLYYTIRFQNVGTAEAIDVRIDDALDAKLDESTFQVLRSSHDYVATRIENQLVWQFKNINLPSQSMDENASQGFVYFKIKPQVGYSIGDVIPNVANIYFDFNPAIITNTFNTEFVEALSVIEYSPFNFSMYPNPANTSVTLYLNTIMDGLITVFDIQGKNILKDFFLNKNSVQLDISAFESGLYFVKLNIGSYEAVKKLIIN